jgi:hypothetical protein
VTEARPIALPEPNSTPSSPGSALHSTQLSLAEYKARTIRLEAQLQNAQSSDSDLARLRDHVRFADMQLREALAELGEAQHNQARLEEEQRGLKRRLRETRRSTLTPAATNEFDQRKNQWTHTHDWIRHEIYLAWVTRVSPTDRADWPLPADYALSAHFAASLDQLDDAQLTKAFKACVDVLTGRVKTIPGRRLHPLREGDGATEADVMRPEDGARCLRAYIEQNTPAARRLHFWQLPGGTLELSRIVTHDDMEP